NPGDPARTQQNRLPSARPPRRISWIPFSVDPCLPQDTSPRSGWQFMAQLSSDGDDPGPVRVTELAMTASGSNPPPAVGLNQPDRVAHAGHRPNDGGSCLPTG